MKSYYTRTQLCLPVVLGYIKPWRVKDLNFELKDLNFSAPLLYIWHVSNLNALCYLMHSCIEYVYERPNLSPRFLEGVFIHIGECWELYFEVNDDDDHADFGFI